MEIIDIPNEQFNLAGREAAFCSSCLCDIQDDSGNVQAGGESSPRGRGCRTPGDALPLQGRILTPRPALGAGSWICRVAAAVSRESRSFSSSPPAEGGPWGSAGHTLLGTHLILCSAQEGLSSQRSGLCSATAGAGTGSCAGGTRFQATVLTAGALPAAVSQMCSAHCGCTKGHFLHQGRSTGMAAPQQGGTVQLRGCFCHIPPPCPSTKHKPGRDEGNATPPKALLTRNPPHLAMLPLGSCFTFLFPHCLLFPLPGEKKN